MARRAITVVGFAQIAARLLISGIVAFCAALATEIGTWSLGALGT
jgi:hypothetical protein